MLDRQPSDKRAAERQRKQRYRQRFKAGAIVAPVEVTNEIVSFLIDMAWLDVSKSEDRREVGNAIARLLADSAKGSR